MPIDVKWMDESKTVLVFAYVGHWDLEDFYESSEIGIGVLTEVQYPVTVVLDVKGSKMIPNGFMSALRSIYVDIPSNVGTVVMVGLNPFARAFTTVFSKLYPHEGKQKPIYFAADYDEVQRVVDRHVDEGPNSEAVT